MLRFESSVKEKDHQTEIILAVVQGMFESSVKEKDHQTGSKDAREIAMFESSVKEKDHQTCEDRLDVFGGLRAV